MPLPGDRLPADLRDLPRKVAELEKQIRELRAARNLEHASIDNGAVTVRDADGNPVARLGATDANAAAAYTGTTIQTGTDGPRVALMSSDSDGNPAVVVYSGLPVETSPGELAARVDSTNVDHPRPYSVVWAPTVDAAKSRAFMALYSGGGPSNDVGQWFIDTGDGSGNSTSISALSANGTAAGQFTMHIDDPATSSYSELVQQANSLTWTTALDKGFSHNGQGSTDEFDVTGDLSVGGKLTVGNTPFGTYTPTVAGGGSATFSTRTGYYFKIGKLVYFSATLIVGAAGTGTSNVSITTPSNMDRSQRQIVLTHSDGLVASGVQGTGSAVAFTSGTGAAFDRIRVPSNGTANADTALVGTGLLAGGTLTVQGWYREA